ncbi:alpha/beta fold hydrolase [Herbaspirillum sp. SJZ107]|uniref:alpha/beta fold hydrolase n=1 Tax=Herbaspirillum sp. SJZ107 TaxID=2572881 RepID=UPI002104DCD9|nr:alpha/beta hydrolase [Herbaspirillum sp. SJZ107]
MQPAQPTIVFLHGALNDHSVWSKQSDALAARGYAVLAPDLPGHGAASPGPALASVEAMADWLLARLDAGGIGRALLVGHSMGSLIALEAARREPARFAGLALLGTAWPMKVSDALLASALEDQDAAIGMVAQWSHMPLPASDDREEEPSLQERSRQLMARIAAEGPPGLLHTDLAACKAYAGGAEAIAALDCPVLFILGRLDRMTPPRAAAALTAAARHGTVVEVDAGHAMMAEQPGAVLDALAAFAAICAQG